MRIPKHTFTHRCCVCRNRVKMVLKCKYRAHRTFPSFNTLEQV